jgi:hypothetical protein
VSAGTLLVTGALSASSGVTVSSGATLGGTGTVSGSVTVNSGGTVAPGTTGVGKLTVGGLSMVSGAIVAVELNGTAAGTGHDQLAVTGNASLNSGTLSVSLVSGYTPVLGNTYLVVDVTGTDTGTFTTLTEGDTLSLGGKGFQISYAAGTGNDVQLTAVNIAPTLTSGTIHALTGVNEDTTSAGALVSAILSTGGRADVDTSASSGIAVTAKAGNGTWQYSTDGTTWTAFGTVSDASALLLTSSTYVRYVPNGQNGETATFTYRAWDQTTGTASVNGTPATATTATTGGTSTFSTNTGTASITVTSVNDAPTLTTVTTLSGATEDQSYTITYAALIQAANEADIDGDTLSFRIQAVSSGTLTKNGQAITAGTTTLVANESLEWTPALNANGTQNAFTIVAIDPSNATSATPVQVQVGVTAVNDLPTDIALSASSLTVFDDAYRVIGTLSARTAGASRCARRFISPPTNRPAPSSSSPPVLLARPSHWRPMPPSRPA